MGQGLLRFSLLAALAAPLAAEEANLSDGYRDVFGAMAAAQKEADAVVGKAATDPWPSDAKVLEEALESNGAALSKFDALPDLGRCHFTEGVHMAPWTDLSHLAQARKLARLVALRARRDIAQGRPTDAVGACLKLLALAQGCANDRVLISRLVETSITRLTCRCLRDALAAAPADPKMLARVLDRVMALRETRREAADAFRAEEATTLDMLDRFFLGDLASLSKEELSPELAPLVEEMGQLDMETRRSLHGEARKEATGLFAAMQEGSRPGRLGGLAEIDVRTEGFGAPAESLPHRFLAFLCPQLGATVFSLACADAELSAMSIRAALLAFRAEKGAFPESLDALAPAHLPAVPDDPYDGKPFRYARGDVECIFWVVSNDLQDDGGKAYPEAEDPKPGTDLVWTVR